VNGAASNVSPANATNGDVTRTSGDAAVKTEEDVGVAEDPEDERPKDEIENEEEEVKEALRRPPPINSDILPLPWKGRLGYVRSQNCGFQYMHDC
jgi:UV DNA damage endonuclease